MEIKVDLPAEQDTENLARRLGIRLVVGDVLLLKGGLGAGKTTFARALIRTLLGREEAVPSPTFTLVQTYDAPHLAIWHFDLYRLEDPEEVYELGWEEATGEGAIVVEWPERLPSGLLPPDRLELSLSFTRDEQARSAVLTPYGNWVERIHDIVK